MHIQKISLGGIKCFGTAQNPAELLLKRSNGKLAGWTVIAGMNGVGKTTLLKSIAIAISGPKRVRLLQENFENWINQLESRARLELELVKAGDDHFQDKGKISSTAVIVSFTFKKDPKNTSNAFLEDVSQKNFISASRGPWHEEPKGWFIAGYGPFRRLSGHASDAQRLMVKTGPTSGLVTLFREDASLVESVQWLREMHYKKLDKGQDDSFLTNVISLMNDGLLPEGVTLTKIDSDGVWVQEGEINLPLKEMSDGFRTAVALVLDITKQLHDCFGEIEFTEGARITNTGVILIDEIDVHLHISWQKKIGFWLKEHFPNIQFIVTTHSPYICQAADPDGLISIKREKGKTFLNHVSDDDFKKLVNGSPEEAVLTELFGLDSPYSQRTQEIKKEISSIEHKIIEDQASAAEKKKFKMLKSEIPSDAFEEMKKLVEELAKAKK